MAATDWLQMVRKGDFDGFELQFLEAQEAKSVDLTAIAPVLEHLEKAGDRDKVASFGVAALESAASPSPIDELRVARLAVMADPKNDSMRERIADLYQQVHGDKPGFEQLLESSGLNSGRPARNAVRMLDICLELKPGDVLISRTEDSAIEVSNVDLESGLFTLKRAGRPRTMSALDLSREYERAEPNDLRVLRQLRPEELRQRLDDDPVVVVIGVLRAHDGLLNQDDLKHELVPRYIDPKSWSKWWTRTRGLLKRCPNVRLEGRAPVVLQYTAEEITLEDETWERFVACKEPSDWLNSVDAYLRECTSRKDTPDKALLQRCHAHLIQHIQSISDKRRPEAFACALITERLDQQAGLPDEEAKQLAVGMLRDAQRPAALIEVLSDNALWSLALDALQAALDVGPAAEQAVELVPAAPATLLDNVVAIVRAGDRLADAQSLIDLAATDPVDYPELVYWLWKGPADVSGLTPPPDDELFNSLMNALHAIGRTLHPAPDLAKNFRQRLKSALGLRDYGRARECLQRVDDYRAITLRRQIEQLEGLGDNAPSRLLAELRELHPGLWHKPQVRVEPWEDPDVLWNTRAGMQRKSDERDELVNVEMRENAQRIGEAASHGDLSENSEYKFALEERDLLRARLAQMNKELSIAQPIDPRDVPTEHIGVGSRVVLRSISDGAERDMTFFGPFDTDVDRGIYNYRAPVCQQIMGLHVGTHVTLALDGQDIEFEVKEISNGLESHAHV